MRRPMAYTTVHPLELSALLDKPRKYSRGDHKCKLNAELSAETGDEPGVFVWYDGDELASFYSSDVPGYKRWVELARKQAS